MRALWQDLAHAARAVLRSRGFTVTTALTSMAHTMSMPIQRCGRNACENTSTE